MPQFEISGKTFEHRETLKGMGAKWNAAQKNWTIFVHENNAVVDRIRSLAGVTVRQNDAAVPHVASAPVEPKPDFVAPRYEDGKTYIGSTRHYEAMLGRRSRVYSEFLSVAALTDYIRSVPERIRMDTSNNRNHCWSGHFDQKTRDFYATTTMDEALKIARDGWTDGVKVANEVAAIMETLAPQRRARSLGLAGGRPIVGRMLAGNPIHMRNRTRQPGKKVVTLISEISNRSSIDAADMALRAAVVGGVADELEANGYSCEIVAVAHSAKGEGVFFTTVVRLKEAGEVMSLADLMFGLGHPSMFRRMVFGVRSVAEEWRSVWGTMGTSTDPDFEPSPSIFHLGRVKENTDKRNKLLTRVAAMIEQIVPDNLPITFNLPKEET